MKQHWRRIAAAVCAAVMCAGACALPASAIETAPVTAVDAQAESLMTRNVHVRMTDVNGQPVNTWESEHFKFYWGNSGQASAVTQSFLEENAKNLEACWDVYMNDLSMEPPTQSVNEGLRDGNRYKVNFYIHETGLCDANGTAIPEDWAYMGYDSQGFAFMFCCVGAMNNSPNPSWVLPHEFGHVVTAHQCGWNDNKYVQSWWEAIANWYREQFLYSDYYQQWAGITGVTDYFETYMKNLHFTPILGRDNYASWAFLQYLTEDPDDLGRFGSDFVKTLMQQGQRDEYPYKEIARLGETDIKDALGHYAKRLATLDLAHQSDYRARQDELIARGEWNWQQIFTLPDKTVREGFYTVPTDRAPQQFGVNLIPLSPTGGTVRATLESLTDAPGADWRACIVVEQRDGKTRYSDLFKAGETMEMAFDANSDANAYITVTATPDEDVWQEVGVPWAYGTGEFDENNWPHLSKTRYPYGLQIEGAEIRRQQDVTGASRGSQHPNGGGFVAATANVDASVYVGPNAKVMGYATVSGNARIEDEAVVTGSAKVSGNAVICGHAVVAENAQVKDDAIVGDTAGVMGNAVVSENGRVLESGLVYNDYAVSGHATVKGTAFCMAKGAATGQAMPDGDYYDDSSRTVTAGSMFGWASPDAYVNSRPYTDGQVAGLEFTEDSDTVAADTYTSTYAAAQGAVQWSPELYSGNGVVDLSKDAYFIADSGYAALHDATYQTAVLVRGNGSIFRFGSDDKYLRLDVQGSTLVLSGSDGGEMQQIVADQAVTPGEWAVISVRIEGDTAELAVDKGAGEQTFAGTFQVDPVDVISTDATYTLGEGLDCAMDFFRVNYQSVDLPPYYYDYHEEIAPTDQVARWYGDLDGNETIDVFDLAYLKRLLMTATYVPAGIASAAAGDCDGDGSLGVGDVIALQKWLLAVDGYGRTGEQFWD